MKTTSYQKKLQVTLFLLAFGIISFGQSADLITLNGKIIDAKTKALIYYATISVPGTNIATVSNSEGEFTIKFPKSLNLDEIEISHISYGVRKIPVSMFNGATTVVALEPTSITLKEVTVSGLSAKDIVKEAIARIPQNYPSQPIMMTGFYRESIKQRWNYISISEAVLDIYKTQYRQTGESDRIKLIKARQGINVKKADTLGVKFQGGPNISLMLDVAKYPHYLFYDLQLNYYDFFILDVISIDNQTQYVIAFKQLSDIIDPLYQGKLYIDAENFAITHAQFSLNLENPLRAEALFVRKKPLGVRVIPISTLYVVNYTRQEGKYYFSYARNELVFKTIWNRRLFNSKYHIVAELAITDRDEKNIVKFQKSETFRSTDILADAANAFSDNNFWGEENIIKPEEDIEKAIQHYGRKLKRNSKE